MQFLRSRKQRQVAHTLILLSICPSPKGKCVPDTRDEWDTCHKSDGEKCRSFDSLRFAAVAQDDSMDEESFGLTALRRRQRLVEVLDEVFLVFDADGEADAPLGNSHGCALLLGD